MYTDVCDLLNRNGLGYITQDPLSYSENFIYNSVKVKLENLYIQNWDKKSISEDKLNLLFCLKKTCYKRSPYLSYIVNISNRKIFTKLRLGCSKLNYQKISQMLVAMVVILKKVQNILLLFVQNTRKLDLNI